MSETKTTELDTALTSAREELLKLKMNSLPPEKLDDFKQTQSKEILDKSAMLADYAIKHLVAHTVGKPVLDLFESYIETPGHILIEKKNDDVHISRVSQYIMKLQIVDKDYMLDLKELKNNESVKQRMVYLLNAVKVLYCAVKNHMQTWALRNNTTFDYNLHLDSNTTFYLDEEKNKRIGIVLIAA
jgi:hypothetical protein